MEQETNILIDGGEKSSWKSLGVGFFFYVLLFVTVYFAFHFFFDLFKELPQNGFALVRWDAGWYAFIKSNGYFYNWYEPSGTAFFPLFPYLWKLTQFGPIGICLLNFFIFIFSVFFLNRSLKLSTEKLLLYISFPSCIFFFLPFTESLFFLFCCILFVGLYKSDQKLIIIGLFCASLTRATALFFVPAIIIMEFLYSEKLFDKKAIKNILIYSAASIIGLLVVVLIQYCETNEWFAFVKQQRRYWRHFFSLPGFPLASKGEKIIWLDGFAFFIGLCSAIMLGLGVFFKLFSKTKNLVFQNRSFWFSSGYIFMVTVYSLFFNPKCLEAQTSLESMNRYVFSTGFFLIFLVTILTSFRINLKSGIIFFMILLASMILLGFGGPRLSFMQGPDGGLYSAFFFIAWAIYISLHYFASHSVYGRMISYALLSVNIVLSTVLFHYYTLGGWVA